MIIAAMYLLSMVGRMVWGTCVEPHGEQQHGDHVAVLPPDLNAREILVLAPLAVLCLVLGVYPGLVTDAVEQPVAATVANIDRLRALPLPAGDLPVILPAGAPAATREAH